MALFKSFLVKENKAQGLRVSAWHYELFTCPEQVKL